MRPGLKATEDKPADLCRRFLDTLQRHAPAFYKTVSETAARDEVLFREAAEPVLSAAAAHLGDGWAETLVKGYTHFVIDVNKSQRIYEREGRYRNKTYQEVFDAVYGAAEFMDTYHWGVLVTMFAWWHHLRIYGFYRDHFLPLAAGRNPRILDLGAGSGVWHILALQRLADAMVTAVDISRHSISLARETAEKGGLGDRITHIEGDAVSIAFPQPFDLGICCLLMEHLEAPEKLLPNLAKNLKERGYAFVTAALTAAEIDHISEFRRESEIISMAEDAGFRVIAALSSAPDHLGEDIRFLPRVLALVLQKRANDLW